MQEIIKTTAVVGNHPRIPIPWLPPDRPRTGRCTEGDVIELDDGRLLLAYTHYYTEGNDHDPADIRGTISADGGRTWSEQFVVQPNDALQNVMSASLVRLQPVTGTYPGAVTSHDRGIGPIGLVYIRNETVYHKQIVFRTSYDEAFRWSSEVSIVPVGCHRSVGHLNGTALVLTCGRIVVPVSCASQYAAVSTVYYSDDGGRHWQRSMSEVAIKVAGGLAQASLGEPSVAEMRDGRLIMVCRSRTGRPWQSFSTDKGRTWSEAEPMDLAGSGSPSPIARIPSTGDLMIVWNQASEQESRMGIGRARLSVAISKDDARTWEHVKNLETLDDRTQIEPPALSALLADKSEEVAIGVRARAIGIVSERAPGDPVDMSDYPYAGNTPGRNGFLISEYPSITFLSGERVAISYDVGGGPWTFEGPLTHLGEGTWINKERLPGLVVMVAPLEWFYQ